MTRNYSDLSPHDFEILVRDLLQAEFGLRMETFPQGRDGGVDIRLHRNGEETVVIQCKHCPGRTFAQIKGQLESEARKIGTRFSARYMLVTSASLTRSNKLLIANMFSGVHLRETDILGVDDLENLLGRHPYVETSNFKLWITSSAVLEHLINSDLHARSAGLVDQMIKRRRLYVNSDAFTVALDILHKHNVCVISGEPGIGKTTLAETLLVRLLADSWQVHIASTDIADIERVWNPKEKQAFLYDDFLGQNSLLESLNKNEDSRLAQVIERVRGSENKLLILTTREYILRQANQVYEKLQRVPSLNDGKIILNLALYTREQKAKILYNHVHFAELGEAARQSILLDRRYLSIVNHGNFNPRIIELVTSNFKKSGAEDGNFYQYAIDALDNPSDLWDKIFQEQLSPTERNLLLVLATVHEPIEISDLLAALISFEESFAAATRTDSYRLRLALKKLEGTFIHVLSNVKLDDDANGLHPDNPSTLVSFANPSFVDYVCNYLSSHPDEISNMIQGCAFFEQIETLTNWEMGINLDIKIAMDFFFGSSIRTSRSPRLASGRQHLLMRSMNNLVGTRSCYWSTSSKNSRIRVRSLISTRNRHLIMLRLDAKYRRSLMSSEMILRMSEETMLRTVQEDSSFVHRELEMIRHIAEYSHAEKISVAVRDAAANRLMELPETPDDFRAALSLYTDIGLNPSRQSASTEAKIRSLFYEFAIRWDREQSAHANSIADCEEAIGLLQNALEDFSLDGILETSMLSERLELLQDEMGDEYEHEYGDNELEEPRTYSPKADVPVVENLGPYERPNDPVEELFDTLS